MAKFSKSGIWDKVPEGNTLIFGDTQVSLQHGVADVEGSPYAEYQLESSISFNTIPACDGRTDRHITTANTALASVAR